MKKSKQYSPLKRTAKKQWNPHQKKSRSSGYSGAWEKYSKKFLSHNKQCYLCPEKSTQVDHIYAHKGDQKLFWNPYNYLPMCRRCHSNVTGMFDMHTPARTEEKLEYIAKLRRLMELNNKVVIVPIPCVV